MEYNTNAPYRFAVGDEVYHTSTERKGLITARLTNKIGQHYYIIVPRVGSGLFYAFEHELTE